MRLMSICLIAALLLSACSSAKSSPTATNFEYTPSVAPSILPTESAQGTPYHGPGTTPTTIPSFVPTQTAQGTPYPEPGTGIQVTVTGKSGLTQTPEISLTPTERPFHTAEPPPESATQTITIWHSWDAVDAQTLDYLISAFQDLHPDVFFDVLYVPYDELQAKYEIEAYQGGGPSIVLGPAEWGVSFYDEGLVVDLTDIAGEAFLAEINPAALGEVSYKDALIGLPYAIRVGVLLFRNKLIVPVAPETYDDLVSFAQAATRGGKVGAYLERGFYYSSGHLYGIGGQLMDEDGYPMFNNQKGVEWLNLLDSFEEAGATEFEGDRDLELFKAGKVGMIIDGSWNIPDIQKAIGVDNLAIDPWPVYKDGNLSGFVQTDNLYLNSNLTAEERYPALQFMGFFLARNVQAILAQEGHIPAVLNVEVDDPLIEQAMIAFEKGTSYPLIPVMGIYWGPMQQAMQAVFAGEATPEDALEQADQMITESLDAHNDF